MGKPQIRGLEMTAYNDPLIVLAGGFLTLLLLRMLIGYKPRKKCQAGGAVIDTSEELGLTTVAWKNQEFLAFLTSAVGPTNVGEEACRLADERILDCFHKKETFETGPDFLKRCILDSHRLISEHGSSQSGGCSIALVYIKEGQLHWASSGDISIYLNRDKLMRLNQRDLYKFRLREKILSGQISEKRVFSNTLKNELTSYLGYENLKRFETSQRPVKLRKSDHLLLCSRQADEGLTQIEKERLLNQRKATDEKVTDFCTRLKQQGDQHRKLGFLIIEKFRT